MVASTTQADVFVPVANDGSTRSDATVLSLAEGDLWIGSTPASEDEPKLMDTQSSVDAAMQSVTELSVESPFSDTIADESALNRQLVDDVLSDTFSE